jgi:hypothetical protein
MEAYEFQMKRAFLIRLDYGKDIIVQLEDFLSENGIKSAFVAGIGAVKTAEIGYYDQLRKEYIKKRFDERAEILSLNGNISLLDGRIFPHIHVVLGYDNRVYGGHLFSAEVFACELFVVELAGETPERTRDEQTGLSLWG